MRSFCVLMIFISSLSIPALADPFDNVKCSIDSTIKILRGMINDNDDEIHEYKKRVEKIDKKKTDTKKIAKRKNLERVKGLLESENKQLRALSLVCREESRTLTRELSNKEKQSKCIDQYEALIPKIDAQRTEDYIITNADLEPGETPLAKSTWLGAAADAAKQVLKLGIVCMYFQAAAGLVPGRPSSSSSSSIKGKSPGSLSAPGSEEAALFGIGEATPLDKNGRYHPITGYNLLLGGEKHGTTAVEPWLKELTEGKVSGEYQRLIKDLDAGKLPKEMRSMIATMQSSIPPLLKELHALKPGKSQVASEWAAGFKNRLTDFEKKGIEIPNDMFLEFAAFVAEAKVEKPPYSLFEGGFEAYSNVVRGLGREEAVRFYPLGVFSDLSIMQINRLQGLRIFPVGFSLETETTFDKVSGSPLAFSGHDFSHSLTQQRKTEDAYEYLRKIFPNEGAINKAFENTQQAFREDMTLLHEKDHRLAMGVEGIFFKVTHEDGEPIEPSSFLRKLYSYELMRFFTKGGRERFEQEISDFSGEKLKPADFERITQHLNRFFVSRLTQFGYDKAIDVYSPFYERLMKFLLDFKGPEPLVQTLLVGRPIGKLGFDFEWTMRSVLEGYLSVNYDEATKKRVIDFLENEIKERDKLLAQ